MSTTTDTKSDTKCTIRTRKFMTNRLLQRKQMVKNLFFFFLLKKIFLKKK